MSNRLKYFYEFGEFRFDPEQRVLYRDGESVALPPKASEVLGVLLDEHGNLVEREHLLNTVWQDTFVEDGNLNNAVSTLRKTLGGYGTIQTVPRRGYRFTPEVVKIADEEVETLVVEKRTLTQTMIVSEETRSNTAGSTSGSRYAGWMLAGTLALGIVAVSLFMLRGSSETSSAKPTLKRTIALIPLRSLQNDGGNNADLVALGIIENLATRLGGLRDLTVLSTRASARLAETESDPAAIGQKLGADAVIEGSYQATDDRVKMIVRLLNVADGSQIWSGSFDEKIDDVLKLQDALASAAASSLSIKLTADEQRRLAKRSTDDVEAHKLYLRGRHEWTKRTAAGFEQSIASFRQAIDLDPSFSLAYAGLADAYALLADYNIEPPVEAFPKAKAAAQKALEIDPDSARARTTLAYVLATFDWDYAEAEREYKAAIEAEPNYATAHQWYGEMLCTLHRYDEAEAELGRAVELDPLVPTTLSERAVLLYYKGEYPAALAKFADLKTEHPEFATSYIFSAWIYGLSGETNEAFENERQFLRLQGVEDAALKEMSDAFSRGGHKAFLAKVAERHVRQVNNGAFPAYKVAHTFARLNDREQTLHWIDRCIENRSPNIIKIYSDRNFDFVRDESRFKAALAKMNLDASK